MGHEQWALAVHEGLLHQPVEQHFCIFGFKNIFKVVRFALSAHAGVVGKQVQIMVAQNHLDHSTVGIKPAQGG